VNDAILQALGGFFTLALVAVTVQNAVLTRALGISRLISLVDETTDTLIFGILLTSVTTLSSILYYLINLGFFRSFPSRTYFRPLVMVLCMGAAFFIIFVLTVKFAPYEYLAKSVASLPLASFNCTVIGTLVISESSSIGYSFFDTLAYGIGSSVGFVLAVLLVTEGQRQLKGRSIPSSFKGLPATLLFLAGLALAVYGLTGYTFSF